MDLETITLWDFSQGHLIYIMQDILLKGYTGLQRILVQQYEFNRSQNLSLYSTISLIQNTGAQFMDYEMDFNYMIFTVNTTHCVRDK